MENTDQILKYMQKSYSYMKNKQIHISILDIFNKTYSENYISDFLAYILNPQLNGIGFEPLKKLMEAAGGEWSPDYESSPEEITITREFSFYDGRRIDLLIKVADSLIIGIEHKVFSHEHGEQTRDYAEKIKNLYPSHQHVFIFLTPDKREAIAKDEFQAIGYGELIVLLKDVSFDVLKDIKKSVFYQDFIAHLEEKFMKKDSLILSDKAKLYLEHAKMIEDLRNHFDKDYEMILKSILERLKNLLEKNAPGEWIINTSLDRGYHQLSKKEWKDKGLDIHFELSLSKKKLVLAKPVEFMIDIEGPGKTQARKAFIDQLEKNHASGIKSIIEQYQLKKSPRSRTYVSKEYDLISIEKVENHDLLQIELEGIIEEFNGFIPLIDIELNRF
ncbi:PD-(D/E)XK nuclease family protein [Neobacillus niacini]|uniref:PDDEXK-like family protein n=1 Tax=Neobacillus niacini TaxID=86668 RepID=UPI00285E1876|nr:PD-(D/E)XK nuclease family protein [Neobacillus niacini]MDR7000993.1 hypothetical protein [Neobacillus niacini]